VVEKPIRPDSLLKKNGPKWDIGNIGKIDRESSLQILKTFIITGNVNMG